MASKKKKGDKTLGTFKIDIEVTDPANQTGSWKLFRGVLVDTGAEATWLPEEDLSRLGIKIFKQERFLMANGQIITRDVGGAFIRSGSFKTLDEVVFAKPGDLLILGARTLEGFNATVDPRSKKLIASGPLPAAAA